MKSGIILCALFLLPTAQGFAETSLNLNATQNLSVAEATNSRVAGKEFSRYVCVTLPNGNPAMAIHSVGFDDTLMTDNGSTFFGNPPEIENYEVNGDDIVVTREGQPVVVYTLTENDTCIENGAGAKLCTR